MADNSRTTEEYDTSEMTDYEVIEYDFPRVTRDTVLLVGTLEVPMRLYFDRWEETRERILRDATRTIKRLNRG